MIVPRYWAEAVRKHRARGRQFTIRRFGWSDTDQADAQAHAESRAQEALARIQAGEALPRRERRVGYGGADGVPIREEIVERDDEIVITRNGYGALCLNTPDVLFADLDGPSPSGTPSMVGWWVLWLLLASVSAVLLWRAHGIRLFPLIGLGIAVWSLLILLRQPKKPVQVDAREAWWNDALGRVRTHVAGHPDWSVRIYRTPVGMRLLATHRTFSPLDPEVQECFRALAVDPVFARMCVHQQCFRARISPKPWRIGMDRLRAPARAAWRPEHAALPKRLAWIAAYDKAAKGFASCHYIETLGTGVEVEAAARVRLLHDVFCRADSALPLA